MKLNNLLEMVFLALVFSTILTLSAKIMDNRIVHEAPYNYQASDAFQHQVRTEDIKEMGGYKNEAPWSAAGYKDVVGFYPPITYHIAALFSYAAGIEGFDALPFLLLFFIVVSILCAYYFFKANNEAAAFLALAITPFLLNQSTISGITTGHGPSLLAQFFLICLFLAFLSKALKGFFIIVGILLASVLLTHTSEVLPLLIFALAYLAVFWISKKQYKEDLMPLLKSDILAFILSVHFIIIFIFTWLVVGGILSGKPESVWSEGTGLYLMDFKIFLIPIAIGLIISLYHLFKKPNIQNIAILCVFVASFGNYIGISHWTFPLRYFWPIYLAFFFGLGLYYPIKLAMKSFEARHAAFLGIILFAFAAFFFAKSEPSQGIMQKPYWDSLIWLKDKTDKEAKVYFFFDDVYRHNALLRNSQRTHYLTSTTGFTELSPEMKIIRQMPSKLLGDCCGTHYPYRKGVFSYGYHWKEDDGDRVHYGTWDLCGMDYYVLNIVSQQIIADYNKKARSILAANEHIKEVYSNSVVSILKNSKPGDECIGPGTEA